MPIWSSTASPGEPSSTKWSSVQADFVELSAGRKQRRRSADELIIFDSSGSGDQDVAAAWVAHQEAARTALAMRLDLFGNGT